MSSEEPQVRRTYCPASRQKFSGSLNLGWLLCSYSVCDDKETIEMSKCKIYSFLQQFTKKNHKSFPFTKILGY